MKLKLKTRGADIDQIISAELPYKGDNPELFETIKTLMFYVLWTNPWSMLSHQFRFSLYPR